MERFDLETMAAVYPCTYLPMTRAPRSDAIMLAMENTAAYCRLSRPADARASKAVDEENNTMVLLVAELTCEEQLITTSIQEHLLRVHDCLDLHIS